VHKKHQQQASEPEETPSVISLSLLCVPKIECQLLLLLLPEMPTTKTNIRSRFLQFSFFDILPHFSVAHTVRVRSPTPCVCSDILLFLLWFMV